MQPPCPYGVGEALDGEGSGLLALKAVEQRPPHRLGYQNLARPRGISQPRGEVHRVARDRVLAVRDAPRAAGHHFATGDADVHHNRPPRLRSEGGHGVADGQRRPHRPLGVVAVSDGCAEDRHDAVADVLVDPAAVLGDEAIGVGEEMLQERVHLLRVEFATERGVAGEVGEEDRDLPALAPGLRRAHPVRRRSAQCRERVEQLAAMPDRHHAELP